MLAALVLASVALLVRAGTPAEEALEDVVSDFSKDPFDDTRPNSAEVDAFSNVFDPASKYIEMDYDIDSVVNGVSLKSSGRLLISFADGKPIIRLLGKTKQTQLGEGIISVLIDSNKQITYGIIDMEDMDEAVCMMYPFPKAEDEQFLMTHIKWRADQLGQQDEIMKHLYATSNSFSAKWSAEKTLRLDLGAGGTLTGVDVIRNGAVTKAIKISNLNVLKEVPAEDAFHFEPPAKACKAFTQSNGVGDISDLHVHIPDSYSPLQEMVMTVAPHDRIESRALVVLSSLNLPGNIAASIDRPTFPDMSAAKYIGFDYISEVFHPQTTQSEGSIWIDMDGYEKFRLTGKNEHTVLGPLVLDLICDGTPTPTKLYTHIDLAAEEKQQCVEYEFPGLSVEDTFDVEQLGLDGFTFRQVMTVNSSVSGNGEDSAIFTMALTRGRTLWVYVDLEAEAHESILRTEVYASSQLLRRTSVSKWLTQTEPYPGDMLTPRPEWHCGPATSDALVADLGLDSMDQRSTNVREAIYALEHPSNKEKDSLLALFLALTGNVAMKVQMPEVPKLVDLDFSLDFVIKFMPDDVHPNVVGAFTDIVRGHIERTQGVVNLVATKQGAAVVKIEINDASLFVDISGDTASSKQHKCSSLPARVDDQTAFPAAVGKFLKESPIGKDSCNVFSYSSVSAVSGLISRVDLWYSISSKQVRRLHVFPSHSFFIAQPQPHISIDFFTPETGKYVVPIQKETCSPVVDAAGSWLHHSSVISASDGFVGCFVAETSQDLVDVQSEGQDTTGSCLVKCAAYDFMVLKLGNCKCTNSASPMKSEHIVSKSECAPICKGEASLSPPRYCGGPSQNAIYKVEQLLEATPIVITRAWIGSEANLAPQLYDGDTRTMVKCDGSLGKGGCAGQKFVVEFSRTAGSSRLSLFGNVDATADPSATISISLDGKSWKVYSTLASQSEILVNEPTRYVGITFSSHTAFVAEIAIKSAQDVRLQAAQGLQEYGIAFGMVGLLSVHAAVSLAHLTITASETQFGGGGLAPQTSKQRQDAILNAYIGCYKDDLYRDMEVVARHVQDPSAPFDTATCAQACVAFVYMSLQNAVCYCGNAYATSPAYVKTLDSECAPVCLDENNLVPTRLCGSTFRNAIYRVAPFNDASEMPTAPSSLIDIQSEELDYFSFSFVSGNPSQDVDSSHISRAWHHGRGTMHVDLVNRRFLLRGQMQNVSAGLPDVDSTIIVRDAELYSSTRLGNHYERCVSMRLDGAFGSPDPKRGGQQNPFANAITDLRLVNVQDGITAFRLSIFLGPDKRVDLYVGVSTGHPLLAMHVNDLVNDVSTALTVSQWSTEEIQDSFFRRDGSWTCQELDSSATSDLKNWDIMRLFFPVNDVPVTDDMIRRLEKESVPFSRRIIEV
eukprot:TRINITY_DN62416_c0_g1_i1.p1 TRINITY_DN62416_c0_g1~~TRINITY_DN62416_c0_g1_i1.p1  ORF type:complete len:1421 (+),score=207.37 TRINITY_DN62416_c0_g1_i1:65-4264(+)